MVKIAVKRGIQNTNNKLMAEEIRVRFIFLFFFSFLFLGTMNALSFYAEVYNQNTMLFLSQYQGIF